MQQQIQQVQERLHQQLELALQSLDIADERLAAAMRHGLLNGGKRVRPFLAYAAAEALGGNWNRVDPVAVAMEMIHSYSLVHDDLPAMDDDDLRRGQPTCHIAFDEATAILAGDALQTAAFEHLSRSDQYHPEQALQLIRMLARGAGAAGMVAGQSIDLNHVGKRMTLAQLENMHRHKTGALIRKSVLMGATTVSFPLDDTLTNALTAYADAIGLAFQVQDDILDIEADTATLGKTQGADEALNKPTYPALLGLDGARRKAADLCQQAHMALHALPGDTQRLQQLADYIVNRRY